MRSDNFRHRAFYCLPFIMLGLAIGLFAMGRHNNRLQADYRGVYFCLLLAYTWLTAILLAINDYRPKRRRNYDGGAIAVLIPVFNEQPALFERCLKSVAACAGNKTIFVINDGSTKGMLAPQMGKLCKRYGAQLHSFKRNRGKRHALYYAVRRLSPQYKYVVTIDSDTVLDRQALKRICGPLKDQRVGATTGNVLLLNERTNALTRMVGSYYWIGLNIFKQAQSSLGMVVCCSGCIAGYRADVIKSIITEFRYQRFLGEECTHSEDRHLTNLVLRSGYKVRFMPAALSYTNTPDTVVGFLKQQQRWKRGYIREATFTLGYAWRKHPILFCQILFVELTLPFFAFGLMLQLIGLSVSQPGLLLTHVLPYWVAFMLVRYIWVLFNARDKIPGMFIYMFFYELALYWQFVWALFTVRNKSWITRG